MGFVPSGAFGSAGNFNLLWLHSLDYPAGVFHLFRADNAFKGHNRIGGSNDGGAAAGP